MNKYTINILNLITKKEYSYPQNCNKSTENTLILFCLENYGFFHKDGFSYASNKDELITITKDKYIE